MIVKYGLIFARLFNVFNYLLVCMPLFENIRFMEIGYSTYQEN